MRRWVRMSPASSTTIPSSGPWPATARDCGAPGTPKWRPRPTWPAYIEPADFARTAARLIDQGKLAVPGTPAPAAPTSAVFGALLKEAQQAGVTPEARIGAWYQAVNDRLTGTYTRYSMTRLFLFGFVVAVSLDLDIVHLVPALLHDPAAADAAAARIQAVADTIGNSEMAAKDAVAQVQHILQGFSSQAPLLFGWQTLFSKLEGADLARKLAGWLLTAFATSFGAQSWFQVLSDALKLRAAGPRPGTDDTAAAAGDAGLPAAAAGPAAPAAPIAGGVPGFTPASFVTELPATEDLGAISLRYETSGQGSATVSSGLDDKGGVSYGSYQLTSQPSGGNVLRFVRDSDYAPLAALRGLVPGSAIFTATWRRLVAADPGGFRKAEYAYIKQTHYDPLVARIRAACALDVAQRSHALRCVVWSTAVQHGPASTIVQTCIAAITDREPAGSAAYDEELIVRIYAERGAVENGHLKHFPKTTSQRTQDALRDRFANEQRDALLMLQRETTPPAVSV
ncbi:hypothetical protein [Dankookia sp. P2]|uniref:VgrG-related protein n=1 Tax=Dankookia sp. P2 TaxID=3423955 RepID=UPI003D67CDB2